MPHENGLAGYESQLDYRDVKIGDYTWRLRALTRVEWFAALGSIQTLPLSKEAPDWSQALMVKNEEMYRRFYDSDAVQGIVFDTGIAKPSYERLVAGDPKDIGEWILEASGIGGNRVESLGRSL